MNIQIRTNSTAVLLGFLLATTVPCLSASGDAMPSEANQQLSQARAATAKYHNVESALADGYVDIDLYIPKMGFHYLKVELVDGVFEASAPEVLVYAPDPHTGRLRLAAAEYIVPMEISPVAPEGFSGNADEWGTFGDLWALHAWIWMHNPDGIFAPMNPLVE